MDNNYASYKEKFKDKILVITGGTGSFGNAILKRFVNFDLKEIRVFSRDEKKQDEMRRYYAKSNVKFYVGDIRDCNSLRRALQNADYVFHAAALKQVPSCEFFPIEAFKTNVLGTENVIRECINLGVSKVVCLSTDKAVYPINAMGISKAMMEKVLIAESRNIDKNKTVICGTRYGNVMGSRGSVIPLFLDQIHQKKPITITDPNMTRFMMTLDESLDLVIYAFLNGNNGDIFVQKAPSATLEVLAKGLLELLNNKNYPINYIGTRHGEKLYESLLGKEEMVKAEDLGSYYRIPSDTRDLNYTIYLDKGSNLSTSESDEEEYNSHNVNRLDIEGMKKLLLKLEIVQKSIKLQYEY